MDNIKTVSLNELEDLVNTHGSVSLVGENGGLSTIIGEIEESSSVPGLIRIETEHGMLYLDPEFDVEIQF